MEESVDGDVEQYTQTANMTRFRDMRLWATRSSHLAVYATRDTDPVSRSDHTEGNRTRRVASHGGPRARSLAGGVPPAFR